MKINREKLLGQLESILPGLSTREIIEQSSCFVFQNKVVMTYNDEVACTQESCLPVTGAIPATPLISILRKLKEEELEITIDKKELLIKGNRKKAGIRMDADILLPINLVEKPKKWKDLPDDFANAITIVKQCAGKDETKFSLTCVRLTPKWIEACDGYQAARYTIKMEVEKPTLVRKESIKYIEELGVSEFSETKNWIHFRNSSGLILSCRRWVEDFPKLSKLLQITGTPTKFPKGLTEAVEKAEIFSAENVEDNQIEINIKPNKLQIIGRGVSGYYQEIKDIKYKGKPLSFRVAACLFANLIRHHNTCEVTKDRLKIAVGKYTYVTVLQAIIPGEK